MRNLTRRGLLPVFPAWAGVDRLVRLRRVSSMRIPRVGGGRPARDRKKLDAQAYSPRGRG